MSLPSLAGLAALLSLALLAPQPGIPITNASPCTFSRSNPIAAGSGWADQFKCYQASGRHVTIVGSRAFEAGTVSGGVCVVGVGADRVQVAACGSFAGDSSMVVSYPAIAYVVDDPRSESASVYVEALFRR
jgi:hypothetical protein